MGEIDVANGLRQGCTLALTLFNVHACLVAERWSTKVSEIDGIGIRVKYKLDGKLIKKYTKNGSHYTLKECQFADNAALLGTAIEGMDPAKSAYIEIANSFGLTASLQKTKFMVVGKELEVESECVEDLYYLGTVIAANGRIDKEINRRITNVSKAFGALRRAVFKDVNFSVTTKTLVKNVLAGSEIKEGWQFILVWF